MDAQRASQSGQFYGLYKEPNAMSRHRYLLGVVLTLVICMFPTSSRAADRNNPMYDGSVDFGAQLLRLDDGCVALDGKLTSGSFFDDLKRVEIARRFEYKKRGRVVTEYPESVTTSIRIEGATCVAASSNPPSSIFQGDSYSLKFVLEWKDGMQLRPAVLSPVVAHCIGSSSVAIPRQDFAIPSITCQMTVESKGVPLGDHLIVSVFAADGTRLTRLSARP